MPYQILQQKLLENDTVTHETVDAIEYHTARLGRGVNASYNTLNQILIRHELLIRKRWAKKSVAQRRRVLLAAWPDINLDRYSKGCFSMLSYSERGALISEVGNSY